MQNDKLVSIIIPVYNVGEYLNECISSIQNQQYKNFEVILVDDGSKDNSGEICDKIAEKDKRFTVYHKKNEGVSVARNLGLSKSNGDYITFIDPDDKVEPVFLSRLIDQLEESNVDCSCCTFYHFSSESIKEGNPQEFIKSSTQAIEVLMWEHWYTTVIWNKLFKRNAIMKNGNIVEFQKGRTVGEDEKWLIDVIIGNNLSVKFFNEKLYYWRIRENSALHSQKGVITTQMLDEVKTKEEILNMFSTDKNSNIYKLAAKSLYDKTSVVCKYAYDYGDFKTLKILYPKLKYGKHMWIKDNFKINKSRVLRRIYWQLRMNVKCKLK